MSCVQLVPACGRAPSALSVFPSCAQLPAPRDRRCACLACPLIFSIYHPAFFFLLSLSAPRRPLAILVTGGGGRGEGVLSRPWLHLECPLGSALDVVRCRPTRARRTRGGAVARHCNGAGRGATPREAERPECLLQIDPCWRNDSCKRSDPCARATSRVGSMALSIWKGRCASTFHMESAGATTRARAERPELAKRLKLVEPPHGHEAKRKDGCFPSSATATRASPAGRAAPPPSQKKRRPPARTHRQPPAKPALPSTPPAPPLTK